jgi:probable rRNA maturation factor
MTTVAIAHTTKTYPRLPFDDIKNAILGKRYELSLVFVGKTTAKHYNETYRQKSYVPNVLSFPLAAGVGEIVICPAVAKRECKKHNMTYRGFIGYLFIHGCLHLKGYDHSDTMERVEQRYLTAYHLR